LHSLRALRRGNLACLSSRKNRKKKPGLKKSLEATLAAASTQGAPHDSAVRDSLSAVSALTRRAYRAVKAVNVLLSYAESGSQIECAAIASLMLPIQEALWSAIDELAPITGEERESP
jgi:hypothetical protein